MEFDCIMVCWEFIKCDIRGCVHYYFSVFIKHLCFVVIHNCYLCETIPKPIHQQKLFVWFRVSTIGPDNSLSNTKHSVLDITGTILL